MFGVISAIVGFFVALGAYFYYDTHVAEAPAEETGNQVETLPSSETPELPRIDKSDQGLTTLSKDDVESMPIATRQLDLSNNQLTGALPAEIRRLQNLEVLNISNNRMTGLPAEVGQLSKLRILNAANNQLTGIPHELGNLKNLEVLDLTGNDISDADLKVIKDTLPSSVEIRL